MFSQGHDATYQHRQKLKQRRPREVTSDHLLKSLQEIGTDQSPLPTLLSFSNFPEALEIVE
jgi:hypothetical protein